MNMLPAMVLSWAGLVALSLLASALVVLAEVRIDGGAQISSKQEEPQALSCELTSTLAAR